MCYVVKYKVQMMTCTLQFARQKCLIHVCALNTHTKCVVCNVCSVPFEDNSKCINMTFSFTHFFVASQSPITHS